MTGSPPAQQQQQRAAAKRIGYGPIWLHRNGDYIVVSIRIRGRWRPVIRELSDSNFDHTVYPLSIEEDITILPRLRKRRRP